MIMPQYVIGVDGGNTMTDYLLFTLQGEWVDYIRDGTCSHEIVGYKAAEMILQARIRQLLIRNRISLNDVAACAFGLAGIDTASHRAHFHDFFLRFGIRQFVVDNDSFLGVLAGTPRGYGVCSVNGTGMSAGGIDPTGNRLQIGGIGFISGEDASGTYIARWGARAIYDSFYRCGQPTSMTESVFALLGIHSPEELPQAIFDYSDVLSSAEMTRIVLEASNDKDAPALNVVDYAGKQLAKTSAGCVQNLRFGTEAEIVLSGSVWIRAESKTLIEIYKKYMSQYLSDYNLSFHILQTPPAAGAVLWAMSLAGLDCFQPDIRRRVQTAVENGMA